MKSRLPRYSAAAVCVFLVLAALAIWRLSSGDRVPGGSVNHRLDQLWTGYKESFITQDGRVKRPKDGDTVSEGQAYAMLRAAWFGDKAAFDVCYRWTEQNLSRVPVTGDNLLSWQWKDGSVADPMPASDADIDYAFSLFLADRQWGSAGPEGLPDYRTKATAVMNDILRLETFTDGSGRVYLLPWILVDGPSASWPQNLSYYSPAHFRFFLESTGDSRWKNLVDTTYFLVNRLGQEFGGKEGVGLVPDWFVVTSNGDLLPMENRSQDFGWEAVRVPIRLAMDAFWHGSSEPRVALGRFAAHAEECLGSGQVFASVRSYNGVPTVPYENPLFDAAFQCAALVEGSKIADVLARRKGAFLVVSNNGLVFIGPLEYYVNSLAWIPEALVNRPLPPSRGED